MTRHAAYYARNGSYSRSYNAECAEAEGRLPESRAAKYMGIGLAAFRAGCRACGYVATEWHHVGKYAACVDYYDTAYLADEPEFWEGAADAYAKPKKRESLMALARQADERARQKRIEEFRQRLIRQRNCSRFIPRHKYHGEEWNERCNRAVAVHRKIVGRNVSAPKPPKRGDEAGFAAWVNGMAIEAESITRGVVA